MFELRSVTLSVNACVSCIIFRYLYFNSVKECCSPAGFIIKRRLFQDVCSFVWCNNRNSILHLSETDAFIILLQGHSSVLSMGLG